MQKIVKDEEQAFLSGFLLGFFLENAVGKERDEELQDWFCLLESLEMGEEIERHRLFGTDDVFEMEVRISRVLQERYVLVAKECCLEVGLFLFLLRVFRRWERIDDVQKVAETRGGSPLFLMLIEEL